MLLLAINKRQISAGQNLLSWRILSPRSLAGPEAEQAEQQQLYGAHNVSYSE